MDKKQYLMEQLQDNQHSISKDGYTIIEAIINEYEWDNEDEFKECVYEEVGNYFIYYADAFDYIREQWITDFKDAFDNGFGENVCTIASYYLEDEVNAFIYDYMDFASLETLIKYEEIQDYLDIELQDDETEKGGTSFAGETLIEFLCDLGDESIKTLDQVNEALIANGIKPIERSEK